MYRGCVLFSLRISDDRKSSGATPRISKGLKEGQRTGEEGDDDDGRMQEPEIGEDGGML